MREIVIEPGHTERDYWLDLWAYRELFYILAWRDISVRYKQTFIGVTWALLQPVLTMLIMTFLFSSLAGLPAEGKAPYSLMVIAGLLPWQLFSTALSSSGQSLVNNANLISRVYFPRLIVPASTIIAAFVDFLIAFVILIAMCFWYQYLPGWRILTLPLFVLLALLAVSGPGLFIAALNVKYRDFRYVIPFIVQLGMYITPVGFSSSLIRDKFGDTVFLMYSLNPMVGVVDGFRWAIMDTQRVMYWPGFIVSAIVTLAILGAAVQFFRKTEKTFADVI